MTPECEDHRSCRPVSFAVPERPGIRLRTLADVFAYAAAEGAGLRIDGTDLEVKRPATAEQAAAPEQARHSSLRSESASSTLSPNPGSGGSGNGNGNGTG